MLDADTVEIAGESCAWRGLTRPESRQTCKGDTRDQYDRLISVCYLDDLDLNGRLVRQGQALAYRRFSKWYVAAEDEAWKAKLGIWQGQFIKPWQWRQGTRLD